MLFDANSGPMNANATVFLINGSEYMQIDRSTDN
jgi:hypothetical protein